LSFDCLGPLVKDVLNKAVLLEHRHEVFLTIRVAQFPEELLDEDSVVAIDSVVRDVELVLSFCAIFPSSQ
jgi:hypothetical protein